MAMKKKNTEPEAKQDAENESTSRPRFGCVLASDAAGKVRPICGPALDPKSARELLEQVATDESIGKQLDSITETDDKSGGEKSDGKDDDVSDEADDDE